MKNVVSVQVGADPGLEQPDTFRCCPLGVQFYSEKELSTYEIMEFRMEKLAEDSTEFKGPMNCTGVVVHCQKEAEKNRYRIWVMFLDIPEETRSQLKCFGKSGDFLCPHCENF